MTDIPGTIIVPDTKTDPWDEAFSAWQQIMVDLNGDGVPDVPAPPAVASRLARQRQNQQLAPDWASKLASGAAGFVDPFNIPSSVAGLVSPGARDAWRGVQSEHPGMAFAGGAASGMGIGGMVMRAASPVLNSMLGGGIGAGSDVIDQAAGVDAVGRGTAAKALLGALPALPSKAMVPAAGAAGALMLQPEQAEAQQAKTAPPSVAPLPGLTPEQQDEYRQLQVRLRNGRFSGGAERRSVEERARELRKLSDNFSGSMQQIDLDRSKAQRPFLEQHPEYSAVAPWVAGAAAFGIPLAGALMSRRAATAPARHQARSVDEATNQFNAAPTPLNAKTLANAVDAPLPIEPRSTLNTMLDYGSLGVAAGVPSAAVVAPYFIDYMQPSNTEAHQTAAKQFTLDKLKERMLGPAALGLMLAGGGRFLGDKAGGAFINPAPRGANLAQGQAVRDMVRAAPDDAALAERLGVVLADGQKTAAMGKALQGIEKASPPTVTLNDMELLTSSVIPRMRQGGGGPWPGGQKTLHAPPLYGPGGGPAHHQPGGPGAPPALPPALPPNHQHNRQLLQHSSSSSHDASRPLPNLKIDIQAELLSGNSAADIARKYGVSPGAVTAISKKTDQLLADSGGDRAVALSRLMEHRKMRPFSYVAAPVAAGSALNPLLAMYAGQESY